MGSRSCRTLFLAVVAYLFALGPEICAMTDTIAATSVSVVSALGRQDRALTILISTLAAPIAHLTPSRFYAMAKTNFFSRSSRRSTHVFKTGSGHHRTWSLVSGSGVCGELGTFSKLIEGVIFIAGFSRPRRRGHFPIVGLRGRPIPYSRSAIRGHPSSLVSSPPPSSATHLSAFRDPSSSRSRVPSFFSLRPPATSSGANAPLLNSVFVGVRL